MGAAMFDLDSVRRVTVSHGVTSRFVPSYVSGSIARSAKPEGLVQPIAPANSAFRVRGQGPREYNALGVVVFQAVG